MDGSVIVDGVACGEALGDELVVEGASLGLAVGLCDGLGSSRIGGYREATLETLTISALLALGLLPGRTDFGVVLGAVLCMPTTALVAGFFSRAGEERRPDRPGRWVARRRPRTGCRRAERTSG